MKWMSVLRVCVYKPNGVYIFRTNKNIYGALSSNLFRFIRKTALWRLFTWMILCMRMRHSVSLLKWKLSSKVLFFVCCSNIFHTNETYYKCNIIVMIGEWMERLNNPKRIEPDKSSTELLMPYDMYTSNRFWVYFTDFCVLRTVSVRCMDLPCSRCVCVQSKTNFLVEKKLGETEEMARMYLNHYLCSFWAIHSILFTIQSLCDLSVLNSMSWYSLLVFLVRSERNKNIPRWFYIFLVLSLSLRMLAHFILFIKSTNYVSRYGGKMHARDDSDSILFFFIENRFIAQNIFPRSSFRHHSSSQRLKSSEQRSEWTRMKETDDENSRIIYTKDQIVLLLLRRFICYFIPIPNMFPILWRTKMWYKKEFLCVCFFMFILFGEFFHTNQ